MKKSSIVTFLALKTVANVFIISGFVYLFWTFLPILRIEANYVWAEWFGDTPAPRPTPLIQPQRPSQISPTPPALAVVPINTQNSIIIEKIDVNSPVVYNVSVTDRDEYFSALENGVAHAFGTPKPGTEPGNSYLFAHSTPNPLEIKRYGAVFTLLNKLELNDRITVFSDGVRYDYVITDSKIVKSFDLSPLLDPVDSPTLTLQTCDPPGIPINRLIIRAELEGVYETETI